MSLSVLEGIQRCAAGHLAASLAFVNATTPPCICAGLYSNVSFWRPGLECQERLAKTVTASFIFHRFFLII